MEDDVSDAFEATLTREERRRGGVFNTPLAIARAAVESAITSVGTVCDPSCGTGTFLVAAVERLESLGCSRDEAIGLVRGVDIDERAVAVARARLPGARIDVGDGLSLDERFDVVVGNPPYVDGLQARFLAHACRVADAVAMVVPLSLLATDQGHAARSSGLGVECMLRIGRVFDAVVDTCVLVLRRGAPVPDGPTWSSLLVDGDVPEVALDGEPLGSSCEVLAGFRQHYYGLRGHVVEGGDDGLPLVTSGSIEPGRWGAKPVRFDGVRYASPRVLLDDVDEPVRSWFRALLRPKVVVATQTRVLEAAVDARGEVVPSVPVVSVVPSDASRVWDVLAVLSSPPVTAWAVRRWGGTALSSSAVKLGAPHVRLVPTPPGARAWSRAAALLRDGGPMEDAGVLMCEAYGVGEEVHAWWLGRRR